MPYYGYYYDPTYFLVLIGVVLSMLASAKVNGTFKKYAQVRNRSGLTGEMAAERILRSAGIYDVSIEHISGNLTDHYDPTNKVLRLSDSVYGKSSVAAVGVAAHECGHAIQHARGYVPLKIRSAIVPVANFGAKISWPMILIGLLIGGTGSFFIQLGILFFCAAVAFQLITLPVELNASNRAVQILGESGMLYEEEVGQTRKVLNAAALTYVAAAASSILQLLRLIILFGGRRDRD